MKKQVTIIFALIIFSFSLIMIVLITLPFIEEKEERVQFVCGVVDSPNQAVCGNSNPNKLGEQLFKANCKACHAMDKKLVGPALHNVHERYERDWLILWIQNAPKMYESGDSIAVALVNENGGIIMSAFPTLKESEIDSILAYLEYSSLVLSF